jgi:putative transposase
MQTNEAYSLNMFDLVDESEIDFAQVAPMPASVTQLISRDEGDESTERLRKAESIGRPIGGEDFMREAKKVSGCPLIPAMLGPKPKPDPHSL